VGLFLNIVPGQYAHVFWLLQDEKADAHPVGGTEFEITPESWDALDEGVRVEIARHLLPGSDVVAAPVEGTASAAGPSAPPKVGRGSGRSEWAAYAADLGVKVTPDMKREDIIQQVERVEE
jgi:hypothetical protein